MSRTSTTNRVRLGLESLARRDLPAITSAALVGDVLTVRTNNAATRVDLTEEGSKVIVRDIGTGITHEFPAIRVFRVDVQFGAGADRLDVP